MMIKKNQYWRISGASSGIWNVVMETDGHRCRCEYHTVDDFGNLVPLRKYPRGSNGLLNQNKTKVH